MVDRIKERQKDDPELVNLIMKVEEGSSQDFLLKDGVLWFRTRLCVPNIPELQRELLKESHDSTSVTHPRSTKMYQDLKLHYWWNGMKDINDYVGPIPYLSTD